MKIRAVSKAILLIFSMLLTISAHATEVIGIQGSWWNPHYNGEGFAIEEYEDGTMVAYWYTYNNHGEQLWLIGTGQRSENLVELDMKITEPGDTANPGLPLAIREVDWGTVTLNITSCETIDMSYSQNSGLSGGYTLTRLSNNTLAAGSCRNPGPNGSAVLNAGTQYIGVLGSWWNPSRAGEGFFVEEYSDGSVVAYWYTYLDGRQMWLIGVGQREGHHLNLSMYKTSGGAMASPVELANVVEQPYGQLRLDVNSCQQMNMNYSRSGQTLVSYTLVRLVNKNFAQAACEELTFNEPAASTIHQYKLEKKSTTGQWEEVIPSYWGFAVFHRNYSNPNSQATHYNFRLTVEKGTLLVNNRDSDIRATEPTGAGQPQILGITPGHEYPEGSVLNIKLTSKTPTQRIFNHYYLRTSDGTQILDLTVRVSNAN